MGEKRKVSMISNGRKVIIEQYFTLHYITIIFKSLPHSNSLSVAVALLRHIRAVNTWRIAAIFS